MAIRSNAGRRGQAQRRTNAARRLGSTDIARTIASSAPTLPDPRRAIYVDFESNEGKFPTLLGVLWHRGASKPEFEQFVFEQIFFTAADAATAAVNPPWECHRADLSVVIERIVKMAEDDDLQIVAYGPYEMEVVEAWVSGALAVRFRARYRDAKRVAKRWLRAVHPGVVLPRSPRSGRYRLPAFMALTGYEVSTSHGSELMGKRLTYARSQLIKKDGDYARLPRGAKAGWTKGLNHNWHDVYGLRHVDETAVRELGCR